MLGNHFLCMSCLARANECYRDSVSLLSQSIVCVYMIIICVFIPRQILSSTPARQNRQSMDSVCGSKTHPYSTPVNKAGPSYKKCTKCDHLVSRNATTCSNCHSSCSRPGHVSQYYAWQATIHLGVFIDCQTLRKYYVCIFLSI